MNLYSMVLTLFFVMDSLGNIPVFISILRRFETNKQIKIILRESFIAFLILTLFVFSGKYILKGLGISTSALSIAGGIILFMIAANMIFPSKKGLMSEDMDEPLVVPLAIPLTAGPSAIAVVLLYTNQNAAHIFTVFLAVLIASIIFVLIMLLAPFLMGILGRRGLVALERLMGMILTTIAVQMFLTGISDYFKP